MPAKKLPIEVIQQAVDAYYATGGVKSEAAKLLGIPVATYGSRLDMAERDYGIQLRKIVDGKLHPDVTRQEKLPKKGHRRYFILTSAQNNTHVHPAWNNILAYSQWLNGLPNTTCDIMVGTYSYQISAYGPKAVKRGSFDARKSHEGLWYAPEILKHVVDDNVEIAPGLVWCGKHNVLPTAKDPLLDMETFNGRKSNVVPHAKQEMRSVASMPDEATKFNWSTGTITQRNYIQKKAGIVAEQGHEYGAVLVGVDSDGNWYVRFLAIGADDEIMDIGPAGYQGVIVQAGMVEEAHVTGYVYWGDIHVAEADPWAIELAFGKGGMLDQLRPEHQFMGDVFSMRASSHHEWKDFHTKYRRRQQEQSNVKKELQDTADFLVMAERPFCTTHVLASNHHDHFQKWLNAFDFRTDLENAKTFCWYNFHYLDAIDRNDEAFDLLEFALTEQGAPKSVDFLARNQSFVCYGAECSLHGDMGANGSKGSTKGLKKLGRPVNKGHDHQAAKMGGSMSAGAMGLNFDYMNGPSAHSISQIVGFLNGERTIVTFWKGKFRV